MSFWQKWLVNVLLVDTLLCRLASTGNLQLLRETISPCWTCMKHLLRYSVGARTAQGAVVSVNHFKGFVFNQGYVTFVYILCSIRRARSGVRNIFWTTRVWCVPWLCENSFDVSWTSSKCRGLPVRVCLSYKYANQLNSQTPQNRVTPTFY